MISLTRSLSAWQTPGFNEILRQEIEQLDTDVLQLQQGLSQGSYTNGDNIKVMILGASEEEGTIRARAGIFYTGVIAGCNCADDPTPVDEHSEYCELQFDIDINTAKTVITLLS